VTVADPQADADLALIKHPLRRKTLVLFVERTGEPLTPDGVSKELSVPLNNVSYHIRVLADAGALILLDERPVGGSLQHFYVVNDDKVTRVPWMRGALGLPPLPEEGDDP
jgi:DNA-binding transcriptional ArsR family regulator